MNKKPLLIAGVVVVAIAAIVLFAGSNKSTAPSSEQQAGTSAETPQTGNQQVPPAAGTQQPSGQTAEPRVQPSSPYYMSAPASGANWEIGKLNTITWTKAAGFPGTIYLVNSAGANVGTILPSTAPDQSSYQWDTTSVSLSKTNASRVNVTAGVYKIRIVFTGANTPTIESPLFNIIQAGTTAEPVVSMINYAYSPKNLTVAKGQKIKFINSDPVLHHLAITGVLSTMSLAPGTSYVVDTTSLKVGTYNFNCDIHPSMIGSFTVK